MKWVGQHIYDFISRFRNDVYLENISTGTIASGGNLGLDSNNKIVKADTEAGELAFNGSTSNGVLTYGGASTIDVESSLKFSSNALSLVNSGVMTTTLTSTTSSSIDVFGTAYGRLSFTSYDTFGVGSGAMVEVLDAALTATGGPLGLKAGGADGTNIAGGNVEIIGGRGTGTGVGGSLRFWSAPAGSSGSSFNTSAVKFSVDSAGTVTTTGAIELGHASDTTLARSAAGTVTIEGEEIITAATIGWHGSTTRIKILHSDFIISDTGRPFMIDDSGIGAEKLFSKTNSTAPCYVTVAIPTGYDATHVMVYGFGTPAVEVWEHQISDKLGVSKGTGNVGTEIDITDVTSSATNYLFILVEQGSSDEIYGGYVTIAAT